MSQEKKNLHVAGAKDDETKPPVYRGVMNYFPRALEEVAKVSGFGAQKYLWKGWESVPDGINRYSDAMQRHVLKEAKGEETDPETGLMHLAHAAWGALAVLELRLRKKENTPFINTILSDGTLLIVEDNENDSEAD